MNTLIEWNLRKPSLGKLRLISFSMFARSPKLTGQGVIFLGVIEFWRPGKHGKRPSICPNWYFLLEHFCPFFSRTHSALHARNWSVQQRGLLKLSKSRKICLFPNFIFSIWCPSFSISAIRTWTQLLKGLMFESPASKLIGYRRMSHLSYLCQVTQLSQEIPWKMPSNFCFHL